MRAAIDRPPPDYDLASVDVTNCRNGYARILTRPFDPQRIQIEQVFLHDTARAPGVWEIVDIGTGIECSNPSNLNPADQAACAALGLSP